MLRILFCNESRGPDYLSDSLLHGLSLIPNIQLDVCGLSPVRFIKWTIAGRGNPYWYMLDSYDKSALNGIYGRGFTLYGKLKYCGRNISPIELVHNVNFGKYDLAIVGRASHSKWFIRLLAAVKSCRHVILDGDDEQTFHPSANQCYRYFKRELLGIPTANVRPISFAIPESLIVDSVPDKSGNIAPLIPGDRTTYIYDDEKSYYESYQHYHYGITMRKAGWDCMRHYEIAMNGCLPLMRDIIDCPKYTMTTTNKPLYLDAIRLHDEGNTVEVISLIERLLSHVRDYNTTKLLAKYVLEESL